MAKKSTAKISNPPSLRVLVVEDSEDDTVVIIRALKKGGYDPQYERVETAADMRQALKDKTWDIILCDYQMPKFSGPQAIAVLKETNIDIPLIIVSGAIGEETAADCMRYGAHDYIMKGNLPRLVPAIERELLEAESRRKRKLAEESFKESEEKYRNLFENANEAIFVVQDVKLVFVNPMTTMMIGYSTEELMTRPFIEFIHPDDRDMVIDRHIRRMKGEEIPHLYSFRIVHRDGNIKWAEANAIVINWQGKAATLSFMSDITESKRAEERLRLSEKKFRTLYDSTCDAVMLLDEKGFFDCNKATLTMFGCATLEEFCSKHPADLSPPQQPCGTDSMVLANQLIATAMEKGSNHFEWVHKRNDTGETFPADVLLSTMELDDKLVIQAVVRDMTERKKAEEKLRTSEELLRNYLEYAPDGVYTNELNGTFLYGNRKCEEIIGYKREELIGKNFLELNILPEKSLNKALELLQANMEGKSTGPDEIELNS